MQLCPSGVEVVCEPVDLLDVFECYYGIPAVKPQTRGIIDGTYTTGTQTFSPGKLKFKALDNHDFQFAYNPNDELSFSIDKAKVEASVTPTITYNSVIVINKHYGINVSVTAISDLTFEQYAELCGSVTYNKDISLLKPVIPLPEALVDIYFELGVFWNVSGTLATEQLCRQNIKHVFHWDWSSRGHEVLQNVNKIYQKENSHQGKVALSGSVSAGGYGKVAVAFITQSIGLDIAEVGVRVEGGMRCEGTYVPYKEDKEYAKTSTDLYNQIKDQRVPLTLFYTSKAEAKLAKWSVNYDIPNIFKIPFQKQITIGEFCSVPDFSDTKLEKDEFGTYFASTKASGQLFSNTDIGFALINDNDKNDATYTYVKDYQGPSSDIYASFFDKSKESKYTVYPLVKYMDMELIAEPFAKIEEQLCKDTNHPHMIDLGLPSGTKWSCCNVGAQKPEDYGAYINWNDAVAMFSDEKSGDLRLPTKEECEELVNECSWTWTTQNGVNGQLVTGPNGNSIFIPAAGVQYYYEEVDVYEEEGVGRMGRFWSSDDFWRTSDGEKYHRAYDIVFGKTYFELDDDGCGGNYSVRPVAKQ